MHSVSLTALRALTWAACLAPLTVLGVHVARELQAPGSALGADPGIAVVRYLGQWSITLLLATLTLSSLSRRAGWPMLVRVRRLVGLFAFGYVCLHLTSYLGFLTTFSPARLFDDLARRPYILVGFAALLTLVPLAVTSTRAWRRRLGPAWKQLHRLVYVAVLLAIVHVVWLSKSGYTDAVLYGSWAALLLLERLPEIRSAAGVKKTPI